ncbi:PREDICTED: galectin-5-like [Priapulus caudatus]|uniref:Galectin n=1 Tax=Priapulus caudatus TaxID=37621 RepID=A0ABM1DQU4_PRICU|nr:PREDICTED: galectin-5-like [Priapulus caudatus]
MLSRTLLLLAAIGVLAVAAGPTNRTTCELPCEMDFDVQVGKAYTITGVPLPSTGPDGFFINLQDGPRNSTTNIGFHLNARGQESIVIRNSRIGGEWGKEERGGGYPFVEGQEFQLLIMVFTDRYSIYVDGRLYADYMHRSFVCLLNIMRLAGDFQLNDVQEKTHWTRCTPVPTL